MARTRRGSGSPTGIRSSAARASRAASRTGDREASSAAAARPGRALVAPLIDRHPQPVARPERDARQHLDALPGNETEPPTWQERAENDPGFGQGEAFPDAHPRACAEREERVLRAGLFRFGPPAPRVEAPRL